MSAFVSRCARHVALLGTLLLAGCGDPVEAARDEVTKSWTCPADRVQVARRDDLDAAAIYRKKAWRATPPPDVAADPGRKALFEAQQNETIERSAKYYERATLVEARGCGKEALLTCYRRSKKRWGENWFYCTPMP